MTSFLSLHSRTTPPHISRLDDPTRDAFPFVASLIYHYDTLLLIRDSNNPPGRSAPGWSSFILIHNMVYLQCFAASVSRFGKRVAFFLSFFLCLHFMGGLVFFFFFVSALSLLYICFSGTPCSQIQSDPSRLRTEQRLSASRELTSCKS